ncbi:MAG: carboxypeptidase-like regulatory domain-containing protein [Bacillota bacterium]
MAKRIILCFSALLLILALAGCFGGGGGGSTLNGKIVGYVSEIDMTDGMKTEISFRASSPGVANATARIAGTGQSAQTDTVGKFTLAGVAPGTYDLTIEKSGWPSVKVYGVTVEAGKTTQLPLRMIKMSGSPLETTPPTVSISCPSPASGTVQVTIDADDNESGISGWLLGLDELMEGDFTGPFSFPMSLDLDTTDFSNGIHTLTLMVMDEQGNTGVKSIPVQIANGTVPGDLPNAPSDFIALMATCRYSFFLLPEFSIGTNSEGRSIKPGISSPRLFSLLRGFTPGTKGTPAGSESVIFCGLDFTYSGPGVTGFKIYRDGVCIGNVPGENWFDGSPVLCPGKAVTYKVSAYNAAGEGPATDPLTRTPLMPLSGDPALTGPENGATVSTTTPTFIWQATSGAEGYFITVLEYDDFIGEWDIIWQAFSRTKTQVAYGEHSPAQGVYSLMEAPPLEDGKTYKWYVVAGATTPDVPSGVNWDTWTPDAVSFSASEVWEFTVSIF